MKFSVKRKISISRVITKITATVIGLWVGGEILTQVGSVMNGTCSPFYKGLKLIGWQIGNGHAGNTNGCTGTSALGVGFGTTVTATNGSGILAVVGLIGLASVVLEFISFKL